MQLDVSAPPVVRTTAGTVRGQWAAVADDGPTVAVFRGIPYAQAPVGRLRFAAPAPRTTWQGELDATGFGATPQRGDAGITLIPEESIPGDDTLNVNVWTPSLDPEAPLPVVVWIHGGGFISGSPASSWYDGRAFARDGVVMVSLSYRLGFVGFGVLDGAAPNRGVLDWIAALRWVRDNIAAFGGDPGRVTIAGQSAGGGAVLTLLGCPAAADLFHGAWAMSAAVADPSEAAARHRTTRLARLAGVTPDVDGFAQVSEARLLELQPKVTAPAPGRLVRDLQTVLRDGLLLGPTVDGEVVVGDVEHAVTAGTNAAVPLVLGATHDELVGMFQPGGLLDHAPGRMLLRILGASSDEITQWLSASDPTSGTAELLGRYATDRELRSLVPHVAALRTAAEQAGPTWTYSFTWHADQPPRAGHCIDVPFVFDRLDAPGVERVAGAAPPQPLADAMHGALVAFATAGDPGWSVDENGNGPSRIFDLPIRETADAFADARTLRS